MLVEDYLGQSSSNLSPTLDRFSYCHRLVSIRGNVFCDDNLFLWRMEYPSDDCDRVGQLDVTLSVALGSAEPIA